MVKTHGLTHVGLAVADPERSLRFYRDDEQGQVKGPGPFDVIAFEKRPEEAGGRLLRRGEFGPGLPFAYVEDPDGYEIEIWYE
jgi:catechol 2,3-dioxygenase-like lactoylglutathione lyase family enzyme